MCQLSEIRKDIQITKLLRKHSNYGHLLLNIYKISLYTYTILWKEGIGLIVLLEYRYTDDVTKCFDPG